MTDIKKLNRNFIDLLNAELELNSIIPISDDSGLKSRCTMLKHELDYIISRCK